MRRILRGVVRPFASPDFTATTPAAQTASLRARGPLDEVPIAPIASVARRALVIMRQRPVAMVLQLPGSATHPAIRHYAYPGNVSWTEEGHNFSWHCNCEQKADALFYRHASSQQTDMDYRSKEHLEPRNSRR